MNTLGIRNIMLEFLDSSYKMGYGFIASGTVGINIAVRSAGITQVPIRDVNVLELEYTGANRVLSKLALGSVADTIKTCIKNVFISMGYNFVFVSREHSVRGHRDTRYTFSVIDKRTRKLLFIIHVERNNNPVYAEYQIGHYRVLGRGMDSLVTELVTKRMKYTTQQASAIYDLFVLSHLHGYQTDVIEERMEYYGKINDNLVRAAQDNKLFIQNAKGVSGINLERESNHTLNKISDRARYFAKPILTTKSQHLAWICYEWTYNGVAVRV